MPVRDVKNNEKYLVFLDLETGGPSPTRHPIIQIAAIAVNAALQPVEAIELKVQFRESQATKHSLRKKQYRRGLWAREALPALEAGRRLASFLGRYPGHTASSSNGNEFDVAQLVAHHASFDGPFLQSWYERLGLFFPARYHVLCTLQLANWYFAENPLLPRPRSLQLAALCDYFGVPFHAADAHDALGDVTATVLLYQAIQEAKDRHDGLPSMVASRVSTEKGSLIQSDG